MILGFLTKYRDYRARVHTGPGGDTSTSYIMYNVISKCSFKIGLIPSLISLLTCLDLLEQGLSPTKIGLSGIFQVFSGIFQM